MKLPVKKYKLGKGETMLSAVTKHKFPGADVEKIFKATFNAKIRKTRKKYTDVTAGDEIFLPLVTKKDLRPVHSLFLDMNFAADASLNTTQELLKSVEADIKEAKARKKEALNGTAKINHLYITDSMKLEKAQAKCKRETSKVSLANLFGHCESVFKQSQKDVEGLKSKFTKIYKEEELRADALISALEETKKILSAQVTLKYQLLKALSLVVDELNDLSRQTF